MNKMIFAVAFGVAAVGSQAAGQAVAPVTPVPPAAQIAPIAPKGPMGGHMRPDRTRQQAQQMADAMFRRFDVNGDGVLTRDEAQQAMAAAHGGREGQDAGRAHRMIDRMFAGVPSVTLVQFQAQALSRFDRQDLNHDGVVTAAERQESRGNRNQ